MVHRNVVALQPAVLRCAVAYRVAVAAVLLFAAIAKFHAGPDTALEARFFTPILAAEITLAMVMLLRIGGALCYGVAGLVFALFAMGSSYKWITGASSCGCFGAVAVHPAFTFTLDVILALAGIRLWSTSRKPMTRPWKTDIALLAGTLAAAVVVIHGFNTRSLNQRNVPRPEHVGQVYGRSVVLEPATWQGELRLLHYIDHADALNEGQWLVVLHRNGCHRCHELLERLRIAAAEQRLGDWKIAAIAVEPSDSPDPASFAAFTSQLSDAWEWIVETPVVVPIANRQVMPTPLPEWAATLE